MTKHRTIIAFDIEGFGDPARADQTRLSLREAMRGILQHTLRAAGVPRDQHVLSDTGDGVLIVVDPETPVARVVWGASVHLPALLAEHNRMAVKRDRIRLRVVIHAGEVTFDREEPTGSDVVAAIRLLDGAQFDDRIRAQGWPVALVVSDRVYQEVVRHRHAGRDASVLAPICVTAKDTRALGWLWVAEPNGPGRSAAPGHGRAGHDTTAAAMAPWHQAGRTIGAGQLPRPFLPRPELAAQVKSALLDDQAGTARCGRLVALVGAGGVGKTVLARAVTRDLEVRSAFRDGIVWLRRGRGARVDAQYRILAEQLHQPAGSWWGRLARSPSPFSDTGRLSWRLLAESRCLLVLDDVRDPWDLTEFTAGDGFALLATTRNRFVLPKEADAYQLDSFTDDEALTLLAAWTGHREGAHLPGEAREVIRVCRNLPLAVSVAGALAAEPAPEPWMAVIDNLRQLGGVSGVEEQTESERWQDNLQSLLTSRLDRLSRRHRVCLEELCIFDGCFPVPATVVARLWRRRRIGADAATALLGELAVLSLVQQDPDGDVSIHDVLLDQFCRSADKGAVRGLHEWLAESYLLDWGGLDDGLPGLRDRLQDRSAWSADDTYGVSRIVEHLVGAGRAADVHRLLAATWEADGHPSGLESTGNLWFAVCEWAGLRANYLGDLDVAQRLAERAVDRELSAPRRRSAPHRAPSVGLELRYALISASVTSIDANVPPRLLSALVRERLWTVEHALACLPPASHAERRGVALAELLPLLPAPVPATLIADALRDVRRAVDGRGRAEALATLATVMPSGQRMKTLAEAVAAAETIDDPGWRASALSAVLARWRRQSDRRAETGWPNTDREADREAGDGEAVRDADPELAEKRDLAGGAPRPLPIFGAVETARRIEDRWARAEALVTLAAVAGAGVRAPAVLTEALRATARIEDPGWRARMLDLVAPRLTGAALREALALAWRIDDGPARARALDAVRPTHHRVIAVASSQGRIRSAAPDALPDGLTPAHGPGAPDCPDPSAPWTAWRSLLRGAAAEGRASVLMLFPSAVPAADAYGGKTAVDEAVQALLDVGSWWP